MHALGSFGRWAGLTLSLAALACSAQVDTEHASTEVGSTRAVLSVTRSASAASPEAARAEAFAGFLRTPADADAKSALGVAGLGLDLPAVGECRRGAKPEAAAKAGPTAFELLDAGEVTLAAGGGVTTLAPRAFPTITDAISGVVYTTRDRTAAPLPAASSYALATTGGSSLEAVTGEGQAPELLRDVVLDGEPLGTLEAVSARADLTLGWAGGQAGDRIYVEVTGRGEPMTCAFADEGGHGSLPAALLPVAGDAAVSVHRVREVPFSDAALVEGAIRFDFELSASVTFE